MRFFRPSGIPGRAFDLTRIVPLDLVFPFTYGLFLTLGISWALSRLLPEGSPWFMLNLAPVLAAAADYCECRGHHPPPHVPGKARSRCMVCEPHVQHQVFLLVCQFHHALCGAGGLCYPAPAPLFWQETCMMTGSGEHLQVDNRYRTPSTLQSQRPSAERSGSLLRSGAGEKTVNSFRQGATRSSGIFLSECHRIV